MLLAGSGVSWPGGGRGLPMMGGFYTFHLKDLDMSNAIFDCPDLSAFTGLDDLGLEVIGQRVGGNRSVLACKVVGEDRWCQQYGGEDVVRDTVIRLGSRTLRATPHHLSRECTPLPLLDVCSPVASKHERSDRSTREALACGGALGADGRGRSSCDGGTRRPGPRCVLECHQHRCPG